MKTSSSYISTYEHLVFKRDPSMTMTVLLFNVWLHNVQVTIRCFFGRKETSFSLSYTLLISFILLPVQLSECTFIYEFRYMPVNIFAVEEKSKNSTTGISFFAFETTVESLSFCRLCTTVQESGLSSAHFQ